LLLGGGHRILDGGGHLRVPACANAFADAAELWLRFLIERVPPTAHRQLPIFALQSIGQPWIDILVGRPPVADYYCLLATPAALPKTTDIPYNLDPDFVRRASASLNGGAPHP
jgi:hypothetical protein